MDRGALQATIHGVAKSQTRLGDFTFTFLRKVNWLKESFSYNENDSLGVNICLGHPEPVVTQRLILGAGGKSSKELESISLSGECGLISTPGTCSIYSTNEQRVTPTLYIVSLIQPCALFLPNDNVPTVYLTLNCMLIIVPNFIYTYV